MNAFRPTAPVAPYFDVAQNAWVLSRYEDVFAGLREGALLQTAGKHEVIEDEVGQHARLYADVQADMERMSSAAWRTQMEKELRDLLAKAKRRRRVDLVREVIVPWAATMLVALHGSASPHAGRLMEISERLFYGGARSGNRVGRKWSAWRSGRAAAELERMIEGGELGLSRSMFFGLTQTLPSFLAKAWLALLENPGEMARLVEEPKLMPNAIEELMRYAGVVHTFYRRAGRDLRIGEVDVAEGQLAILKLDSANFDPAKFEEPERLDVRRRTAGQLGLGTGLHACVGAVLVRMACSVVMPVFLGAGLGLERGDELRWSRDKTLLWPSSVPVRFE